MAAKEETKQSNLSEAERKTFAELQNKIHSALKVEPQTNYLLLVKKGSLTKIERDVFLSLWRRNLGTGALIFEVDDPEKDVRAMEVKPK